jgi:transposase
LIFHQVYHIFLLTLLKEEDMSKPIPIMLTKEENSTLEKVIRSPSAQAREILRSNIVLLADAHFSNQEIAERLGCNINTARLWRNRFHALGMKGLKDLKGRGRKPIYNEDRKAEIISATLTPPEQATHWSARRLGKKLKISKSTIHRIWKAHDLKPHLVKSFKYSRDPMLVEKVIDIIGLYLNPPEQALVLSVDEKSQIQALERSQPMLPLGPGRPIARTYDYKRHGTTTLYAALNLTEPEVIGQCTNHHRHQEFLGFMRKIDQTYPIGEIHIILDNYGTHTHPKVEKWFERRPRYYRHFTPKSASWMNMVEAWFSILTRQRVRRGSFTSEMVLIKAIHNYIRNWNKYPVPFKWVKTPNEVLRHYNIANNGTEH